MNRKQAKEFSDYYEKDSRGGYHIIDFYSVYVRELSNIYQVVFDSENNFTVVHGLIQFYPYHWWDGASGPTLDDETSMRASLIHDAIYRLIEIGVLPEKKYRKIADKVLLRALKDDGMWFPRARLWFKAVRVFGGLFLKKGEK